ncbi:MAG: hypothetical protein WC030_00310 [Candidatus Paceibacterota bacterium]
MKKIADHVEHLKTKPHHVRRKVALGVAGGVTSLVAVLWLGVSLSTNAFAIQGSTFAESTAQGPAITTVTEGPEQNLAGAAAARQRDASGPARIEIVNIATTSAPVAPREQTTIPF